MALYMICMAYAYVYPGKGKTHMSRNNHRILREQRIYRTRISVISLSTPPFSQNQTQNSKTNSKEKLTSSTRNRHPAGRRRRAQPKQPLPTGRRHHGVRQHPITVDAQSDDAGAGRVVVEEVRCRFGRRRGAGGCRCGEEREGEEEEGGGDGDGGMHDGIGRRGEREVGLKRGVSLVWICLGVFERGVGRG